jgi:hypothetical protein
MSLNARMVAVFPQSTNATVNRIVWTTMMKKTAVSIQFILGSLWIMADQENERTEFYGKDFA